MEIFKTGVTYSTRSVCDHDCIIRLAVVRRTAHTITADTSPSFKRKLKVLRIAIDDRGNETVKPWGSYSMCPIIDATDTAVLT